MSTPEDLKEDLKLLEGRGAEDVLSWAAAKFPGESLALSTSFGVEDQVLTHMAVKAGLPVGFFTLDTGRLFPEVYGTMQRTIEEYKIAIEAYAPDPGELADLVREKGPNLFYESRENRLACCGVRKVHPLRKALAGKKAWITGLRREQSQGRSNVEPVQWDAANGLWKVSPLYAWSESQVWDYAEANQVPVCVLQTRGFRSLGCAPCTRAVAPGEDLRSGRWWWEEGGKKECGLHHD